MKLFFVLFFSKFIRCLFEETKKCSKLALNSTEFCYSCSEEYYSVKETVFASNPFPISDCILRNKTMLESEIFVSNNICLPDAQCDGSKESPFDNFIQALDVINNKSRMHSQTKVLIFLLGDEFYILEKDLEAGMKAYFRRSLVSLSISPLYCEDLNIPGCKDVGEYVIVNIKSNQMIIFVSSSLTLRNVVFIGLDMALEVTRPICYNEKKTCCVEEYNTLSLCNLNYNQETLFNSKLYSFGMFTSEPLFSSEILGGYTIPQIFIKDCKFESISTLFPSETPRFSGFLKIFGSQANIILESIILINCSMAEGLLTQLPTGIDNLEKTIYSSLKITKVSFYNHKRIFTKDQSHFMVFIDGFRGEVILSTISLSFLTSSKLTFLNLTNIESIISIFDVFYGDNKDLNFLHCKYCKILKIEGLTMIRSNFSLLDGESLLNFKNSEYIFLNEILIYSFNFTRNLIVPDVLLISNVNQKIVMANIQIVKARNFTIKIENSILELFNFIVIEFKTNFILLNLQGCVAFMNKIVFTYVELWLNGTSLISIRSKDFGGDYFNLQLRNSHFSNIMFLNYATYNGVIDWPVYTKKDGLFMSGVSIFNCTHYFGWACSRFFNQWFFSNVHIENVVFSYNRKGQVSLISLNEVIAVNLWNISFTNNERLDYYLIQIFCFYCWANLWKINVEEAAFTLAAFLLDGCSGIYEEISFTNISVLYPSPIGAHEYLFIFGIVIMNRINFLYITNWLLRSSQENLTPSRLFFMLYNINVYIQNVSMILYESFDARPEIHILTSYFNENITVERLNIHNFSCQKSFPGNIFYEGGLISFFYSRSFLKDSNPNGQIKLMDVVIDNCNLCKNGVIGIINVARAWLKNISVFRSENTYGGALAIYYGLEISIENLIVQGSSATRYGGALFSIGSKYLILQSSSFYNVHAQVGGAAFLKDISNVTFLNLDCFNIRAVFDGGVIYAVNSNLTINGGYANQYFALKDGGFIYIKGGSLNLAQGFIGVWGSAIKGGFIFGLEIAEVLVNDIQIKNGSVKEKGASFYLEECSKLTASNITLSDLKSGSGVGNIFIYVKSKPAKFEIKNIYCLRVSLLSSVLVYSENELKKNVLLQISLNNIQIAQGCGSVANFKSSQFSKNHFIIIQNITLSNINEDNSMNPSDIPEIALEFLSLNLFIKNISFKATFFKFHCLSIYDSEINLEALYFESKIDSYIYLKPRLLMYFLNSSAQLFGVFMYGVNESTIALILAEKSSFSLQGGNLFFCHAYFSSCIEMDKSTAQIRGFHFIENKGVASGVLNSRDSCLILENCTFKENSVFFREGRTSLGFQVVDLAIIGKESMNGNSEIKNCNFSETTTGLLILVNSSSVNISFCNFFASSNSIKAILSIKSDIEIFSTNFTNFISKNGGTLKIENENEKEMKGDAKIFSLQHSVISNSSSDLGGAFSLFGLLNINISKNLFSFNNAIKNDDSEYGNFGVGVFICISCENTTFHLLNNIFVNNYAENGIATVFSNFKVVTSFFSTFEPFDSNEYLNNTDCIGFQGNISYLPIKTIFFIKEAGLNQPNNPPNNKKTVYQTVLEQEIGNVIGFKSGQAFTLAFYFLDGIGQEFPFGKDSVAVISDSSIGDLGYFYISNKECLFNPPECLFNNLIIKADINKSFWLEMKINLKGQYMYSEIKNLMLIEPQILRLFSKPCGIGEIFIEGDSSCFKCPFGKFSLVDPMKQINTNFNNLRCLKCPENAICPGGSYIIPKKGYWRYSNSSTLLVECLSKFSCLGDEDGLSNNRNFSINGKCLENSYGPLCYLCNPGYGRLSKKGVCRLCKNEVESYIKLAIEAVFFFIYSVIQIKSTYQISESSSAGILLKIIVTHFQQLSLISLVDLGWTPEFQVFFYSLDVFSFLTEDLLPLECLLQNYSLNVYTQKVIATSIYPILLSIIVFIFSIFFLMLTEVKKSLTKFRVLQISKVIFFIIIVLIFPKAVGKCLSMLTCIKVDDSSSITLLLYSPDVICWSQEHKNYVLYAALPGLLMWGLISPLIIAYFLIKYKKEMKVIIEKERILQRRSLESKADCLSKFDTLNSDIQMIENAITLKFICKGYSTQYFYWEIISFFQKFLLISVGCITDLSPSKLRGIFILVLASLFLWIQIRCQPFESSILNKLEILSLLTIFLTADAGILMYSKDFRRYPVPLLIFVIGINSIFLLVWLWLFLNETILKKAKSTREHTYKKKFVQQIIKD